MGIAVQVRLGWPGLPVTSASRCWGLETDWVRQQLPLGSSWSSGEHRAVCRWLQSSFICTDREEWVMTGYIARGRKG